MCFFEVDNLFIFLGKFEFWLWRFADAGWLDRLETFCSFLLGTAVKDGTKVCEGPSTDNLLKV